ncbi:hypothetical protein LY90DRAFT_702411 [Neocallimastix californiae]|uniref:Jacalin-type lectin domain-containing protein n=1 Tax=Neocallimastix californiae TaxID=1754190 RepID=A0A1Y2D4Y2_9FUNG|nr:hypothetical protein LY90DRAFT_702411 [Neocallimastix californiae]|eukprot:ORY54342.1 hypothetical protein LY90DRAFT_702411 [Neocallimastix californiae]
MKYSLKSVLFLIVGLSINKIKCENEKRYNNYYNSYIPGNFTENNIRYDQPNSQTYGSFTILSYNVGGLPAIISSSSPAEYTHQISPKLNKYDIVNVQEDFGYNDELTSMLDFPYQTEFSGNVPFGNGLMTFSKFPLCLTTKIAWEKTHGFISDGADQMIPKGFTFASVEIRPGYFIDIYNIHTDADTDEESLTARRSNMAQLAAYINTRSAGKAVIVFGDTNSRYTREGDNFDESVLKPCNLKDAWVQNVMGGVAPPKGESLMVDRLGQKGEVVDKIWFRSGKNIEINAATFELLQTEFTDAQGNQLSDHYPITSRIDFKLIENFHTTDTFGGKGGQGFSFLEKITDNRLPISVTISSGDRIDRVGFTYVGSGLVTAGGNGGKEQTYVFKEGEYISSMTVSKATKNILSSNRISYISLVTNLGNVISAGNYNDDSMYFKPPEGYAITGFIGSAEDEIDRIGCIYQKL